MREEEEETGTSENRHFKENRFLSYSALFLLLVSKNDFSMQTTQQKEAEHVYVCVCGGLALFSTPIIHLCLLTDS